MGLQSSLDWCVECNFPRFKYVVQVVIGEQRGEGVRWVAGWIQGWMRRR
jgi:hypothetical protein